jgi:hypothetical protein
MAVFLSRSNPFPRLLPEDGRSNDRLGKTPANGFMRPSMLALEQRLSFRRDRGEAELRE